MNNDTGLYDVTKINKLAQGSPDNLFAMKEGKFCMKVHQVDGSEWVHNPCPMKYCAKAGANLYSLICKLLQGNKMKIDHKKISSFIAKLRLVTAG